MTNTEEDRISWLPDHLTCQILSRLPIKEAGRTSVLSSEWRKKWITQLNLVFDRRCVSAAASDDPLVIQSKFLRTIDQVLLLYSGPIKKFKISDSSGDLIGVNSMIDIDRWIFHITGRSIKELVLKIWIEQHYKIPWCLFSCQSLERLRLSCCWLKPPTTFEGFKNLKSLELKYVTVAQNTLENLISGCPLLKKLILVGVNGLNQINIHAPNLMIFRFIGKFEDINFEKSFQLRSVAVGLHTYLHSENNQRRFHECSSNLLKLFFHQPQLQSLKISDDFLKYLAVDVVPVTMPKPFINLRTLAFGINFNYLEEIKVVLCLLKSSPNLRKCRMVAHEPTDLLTPASYCWEDIFSEPATPLVLRHVGIENITGTKFELDFIKFLLLYSPELEMIILTHPEDVKQELMTKLIRFKRASAKAEVIYHGVESS